MSKSDKVFWWFFKILFPRTMKELKKLKEEYQKAQNQVRLKQAEVEKSKRRLKQLERQMR